jgi:broad specificity phosphatase PhoE
MLASKDWKDFQSCFKKFQDVVKQATQLEGLTHPSILTVSHGGTIHELFGFIFDDFGCDLPPGSNPGDHKIRPKNTSWSTFEIVASKADGAVKTISCTTLKNSDHLTGL